MEEMGRSWGIRGIEIWTYNQKRSWLYLGVKQRQGKAEGKDLAMRKWSKLCAVQKIFNPVYCPVCFIDWGWGWKRAALLYGSSVRCLCINASSYLSTERLLEGAFRLLPHGTLQKNLKSPEQPKHPFMCLSISPLMSEVSRLWIGAWLNNHLWKMKIKVHQGLTKERLTSMQNKKAEQKLPLVYKTQK